MLNKVLLWITILASLGWIGYVGLDILNENNNYSPEDLFGNSDEKILIINRPDEVDIDQLSDFMNAPAADLVRSLNPEVYETAYVSANQAHLLLKKTTNWTEKDIQQLFEVPNIRPLLKGDEFSFGEYQGRFYKKGLYMSRGEIAKPEGLSSTYQYDKKASASIVHFSSNSSVQSVSDIYFKEGGRIDYITYNDEIKQGNQVKDEVIFSNVVTKNFSNYHFFERDYYATLDSTFANGPMFNWILNGFLELDYEGTTVLICDYIGGQDPILILNDLNQTQDVIKFKQQLTRDFPSSGTSYFAKYLEDLVVFSESEDVCDKVIADFKLGNTIALNKRVQNKIYGSLPQSVSERIITKEHSYSKAVYRGKLLETQMGILRATTGSENEKESIAMNCGFDVLDFVTFGSEGNLVALGKKGELVRFKNGKTDWTKRIEGKTLGTLEIIDLHQSGEKFVLVNTVDKIHLWNMSGNPVSGFPIALENEAINQVKFYRWKGKSYFLIANENDEVIHYDARGRELNVIKSSIKVTRKVDVWASQQTLFAGFANDQSFVMYNLDNRKVHRKFPLPVPCIASKVPNELFQYGIENNKLVKINQKGLKFDYKSFIRAKLLGIQSDAKNPTIIVQSANEIHLLNAEGISFSKISLPFNEVADVFIETSNSGKTTIAIIDGLENNVYLYGLDGERLTHKPIEGQTKVNVNSEGNTRVVTTVVDQYIVQYFE